MSHFRSRVTADGRWDPGSQISYDVDPTFGCWLWTGRKGQRDGRPIVWRGRAPYQANRAVYEQMRGPIAEGLVLDHLCRRGDQCVAPHHLEPITKSENERRKSWRYRTLIKTCPRGHSLADCAVTPEGGRVCRTCNREATGVLL